jgi:predicted DNA-binding ribbon-helix-helix protein
MFLLPRIRSTDSRELPGWVSARGRLEAVSRNCRFLLVVALSASLIGCGLIERLTGEAARKRVRAEAAEEQNETLQLKVMRFADQYVERIERRSTAMVRSYTEEMAKDFDTDLLRADLARWQFVQASAAYQIAAGSNPTANAVDMVVLTTLTRMIAEYSWAPQYGPPVEVMLRTLRSLEEQAWHLLDGIATEERKAELAQVLRTWYEDNPGLESAAFVRFTDVAGLGAVKKETSVSPGLLGIIGLDPLEGIDPALREVERARIMAERALFYSQRVAILIDLQLAELAARAQATPEIREVVETVDQVGQLSAAMANVVDELPETLAREREAAISQLMAEMYGQQREMLALTREIRGVLDSGNATAQSLDALINSTERLLARFEPDPDAPPPSEPRRPFDINDYTRTAAEFAATARELHALVQDVDSLTPKLAEPIDDLSGRFRGLVDYAFSRILLTILALLAAALVYRVVSSRIKRTATQG